MELKCLNTFMEIVREGSFTRAAEKLNYTQSTITFQVKQLEQELGAELFEKLGRRMVLTKAGSQLVPYVEDVLSSVEKLRYFENDLSRFQGELNVGVAETLLCYRMPEVLKRFHSRAPKARMKLRSMNCYDIRDELLAGTLDVGVFYQDVGGFGAGLELRELGSYPVAPVASPGIREQCPELITPDRAIPLPFIINEKNCIFRQIFEQYLREKSIILDHTIELWSIPTIKNLVKSDMGISFLPEFAVAQELESGELMKIPTDIDGARISAVCGWHKNKWISPLMELFIGLCSEIVPDQPETVKKTS